MRLHAVGLPHLDPLRDNEWCAYSQKQRRLRPMLEAHGHELVTYGGPACDVPLLNEADRARWFGGRDWRTEVFDQWNPDHPAWTDMATWATAAIRDRIAPGDAIGLIAGRCQARIADPFAADGVPVLEWGVGYAGVLPNTLRCFESHAWRHHVAGLNGDDDHRFYDTVIPNAFDPDELAYSDTHDGYALFLGRLTPRKGVQIAIDACAEAHVDLILAGQGDPTQFTLHGDVQCVGTVTGEHKVQLLSRARCLIAATTYLEPFGGVAVEAMMCGTPAITTDWGAFTETVDPGVSGWRCSTLGEFVEAIRRSEHMDRSMVAAHADRYTLAAVGHEYDAWLRQIATLDGPGWYDRSPGRFGELVPS